jgi:adenine-specific DNA-methyltransferase
LRRELDFFIKNEVMHLDDIEDATASRAEQYLAKIKAIRVVAGKIIAFLAELEDFQKKLWLKKKFIYSQHYLVPVSLIPLELRDAARDAVIDDGPVSATQKKAAKKKAAKDSLFAGEADGQLIDTSQLDDATAAKVISSIEDMHEAVVGDLIHSENFSALSFIQRTYSQQVGMIYIDPPFNLAHNGQFLYRTDYKDSTWTSLLHNRLSLAKPLLHHSGWAFVRCDINGNFLVRHILNQILGSENFHAEILVQRIRKNVTEQGSITLPLATDSLFLFGASQESELHEPFKKLAGVRSAYWRRIDDSAGYRNPPERTIMGHTFYPYKPDAHFKFSQKAIDEMLANGRIRIRCADCGTAQTDGEWTGCKGCGQPRGVPQYLVEETDRQVLDTNWTDIAGYSHTTGFSTENALPLLKRCIETGSGPNDVVLDFFAGSGTTGHAVMSLNAEKAVSRRFVLVEVGSHFDSIVIPRLAQASKELHNSGVIRVLRLEQYEDTLNNLELKRPEDLDNLFTDENSALREEYMLRYMLDVETRGSASLLNASAFVDPRKYTLRVKAPGSDETVETPVDLLETFNWLLGLRVRHIAASETFDAAFTEKGKRLVAELTPSAGGPHWFRQVSGVLPDGREVLVVWRMLTGDAAKDEAALLAWCEARGHLGSETLDVVYVNGDCNLLAAKPASAKWALEPLEARFHELMFEGVDS